MYVTLSKTREQAMQHKVAGENVCLRLPPAHSYRAFLWGKERAGKTSHTPRILAERQITKGLLQSILFDNCTCPGVAQRTFWEYKILETTLWAF